MPDNFATGPKSSVIHIKPISVYHRWPNGQNIDVFLRVVVHKNAVSLYYRY